MKTQKKLIYAFAASLAMVMLSLVLALIFAKQRQNAYQESILEQKNYSVDVALKKNNDYLAKFALDYTLWDELSNFANGKISGWEQDNINTLLSTSQIKYVWVFNSDQELVYSIQDTALAKVDVPIPSISILKMLDTEANMPNRFCSFYKKVASDIIEIAGATIHNSSDTKRQNKPNGYFFIARLVDKESLFDLEIITNSKVSIHPSSYTQEAGKHETVVLKNLNDWQDKPVAVASFVSTDDFAKTEDFYNLITTIVFIVCMIINIIILTIFVKKSITNPLNKISESLDKGNLKSIKELIDEPTEFGEIARLIKDFLAQKEALEKANAQLIDNNHKIEEHMEQIAKQNLELEELNSTKDKFFSIIAHDLRNPFGVILATTEFMTNPDYHLTMEEIMDFSKDVNDSAKMLFNLLENLLTWARSQKGTIQYQPETLLAEEIAANTKFLLAPQANDKGIRIDLEIPKKLKVLADKNMLTTILRNLVSNSIKFTNEGGEIIIKAELLESKNGIVFSVKDTGVGMTPDQIRKLFRIDVHCSTCGTKHEKGTGLGLILCKEFVEKHNGNIWLESELGKGSNFKFLLPIPSDLNASYEE